MTILSVLVSIVSMQWTSRVCSCSCLYCSNLSLSAMWWGPNSSISSNTNHTHEVLSPTLCSLVSNKLATSSAIIFIYHANRLLLKRATSVTSPCSMLLTMTRVKKVRWNNKFKPMLQDWMNNSHGPGAHSHSGSLYSTEQLSKFLSILKDKMDNGHGQVTYSP